MRTFRLIFILIFFIIFFYFLEALSKLYTYKSRVDKSISFNYDSISFFFKDILKREYIKFKAPRVLEDNESRLKSFYITIKESNLAKLNSNLPESGRSYVKGYLKIGGEEGFRKIKLRYRGDTNLHWNYTQKSLRIKLLGGETYKMNRVFNLINPPHDFSIIDCVAYDIAREIGLLSPMYEPVRVFINGKFMGVYMFLTQVEEGFLRANRRMPGSIYYGDLTIKDMVSPDIPADLFFDSKLWIKKASRNREQKYNREDIEFFIKNIDTNSSEDFYNFAIRFLNLPKYYAFFALDTLFGAFHHDYAHNHKLYFDPYIGKFEPIEWDLRYWSAIPAKDLSLYPLFNRFKSNPLLEAQRDKFAFEILKRYPAEEIVKRLEYYKELILPDLKRDIYKDTGVREKFFPKGVAKSFTIDEFRDSIQRYENAIINREKFLKSLYNNTKLYYNYRKISEDEYNITLMVEGNSPILFRDRLFFTRRKYIQGNPLNAPAFLYGKTQLVSTPTYFSIILKSPNLKKYKFINYVTNQRIEPIYRADITPDRLFEPINLGKSREFVIFSGELNVTRDLILDSNTTAYIYPNTTFNISANVSIFFYGKVLALGTEKKPIIFKSAKPDRPFGAVVVQGEGANGSRFYNIRVSNGTKTIKNLIHYTAPFNIHNLKDFQIKESIFTKNSLGDDLVHIAYSKGEIENSTFQNGVSDCLDIDISDIKIYSSTFKNCGNDGLDLMTTELLGKNNLFLNTQDKGLSVGESSDVNLTNSIFKRNYIGVEVKDNSILYLIDSRIEQAKFRAINLYRKNRYYDRGGTIFIKNVKIIGNSEVVADKFSKIEYIK